MLQSDANRIANSVDPDLKEQSGLGLHCLHSPISGYLSNHYDNYLENFIVITWLFSGSCVPGDQVQGCAGER